MRRNESTKRSLTIIHYRKALSRLPVCLYPELSNLNMIPLTCSPLDRAKGMLDSGFVGTIAVVLGVNIDVEHSSIRPEDDLLAVRMP